MRTKRFLLVTAALSTAAAAGACGKNPATPDAGETLPLPANPKGSFYDAGMQTTPEPPPPPPPPPTTDAGQPIRHPLPANPKGSHYDAGKKKGGTEF